MPAHFVVWPVELTRAQLPKWKTPAGNLAFDRSLQKRKEAEEKKAASGNEESATETKNEEGAGETKKRIEEEAGWLGIEFKPRVDGHLVITNIMSGGPADGINSVMVGDLIIGIRGFMARALTPVQMAELAKGTVGSKLSLLLGAEYMGGKYSYTTQHVLQDGSRVHVSRVKVISMTDAVTPCRVEPDVELLSPGVVQLGAMRQSDDCLPDADDMDDDDIATVQRKVSKLLDDDAEKAEADARQEQCSNVLVADAENQKPSPESKQVFVAGGQDYEAEDSITESTEDAKSSNDNDSTTSMPALVSA